MLEGLLVSLAIYLFPVGLGVAALLPSLLKKRRRLHGWQDASDVCGLQVLEISGWSPRLTARAGPATVTIEAFGESTRIVLRGPVPPSLHTVSIRREPLLRRTPEIEIGDPSFDSTFFIEGPMRQVLSLLDAEMRDRMIRANRECRLQISTGLLQADLSDKMVLFFLPLLVDIAQRLAQPMDDVRRLADNAKGDLEAGVRLQNLLCLIRELPEAPETIEALRTACSDPSPEIRLRAAKGLGAEGCDLLLDLAESLVDDTVSAEAVSTLDRELSFERTKAILDQALDRGLPKTARACLEALAKSGGAAAVEPPLLLALQCEQADLRVAAANVLGRVGSVEAVLPLQEAAERSWLDRELHRAARQAIAEIQSRLQGASPGQLSVAKAEAGQLSLTHSDAGQLSLAPAEPGEPEQPAQRAREEPGVRLG